MTLTKALIQDAISKAQAMRGGYIVEAIENIAYTYWCVNLADRRRSYLVSTLRGFTGCTCPQYKKTRCCKHQAFVKQSIVEGTVQTPYRPDADGSQFDTEGLPAAWPVCAFHGPHAPMMGFPGLPETDCERCIKNALR